MQSDWRPIDSAPRDGTWIELKNNYGLMPTYSLSRWAQWFGDRCAWVHSDDPNVSNDDGPFLEWRPYHGDPASYVDPTNGRQRTDEYWDVAVAQSAGISVARLHNIRKQNRVEQQRFGNGTDAPYWPRHEWNADYTLRRGVWCNSSYHVPSRFTLWMVRRRHAKQVAASRAGSEGPE